MTMTTEDLRAAIEAALRRRDSCADVCSGDAPDGFSGRDASAIVMHGYAASRGDSDAEALRRLARLTGLGDDGSDPAEEVERLSAEVATLKTERDEARADAARAREAYAIDLAGLRDALRRADDDRAKWRERVAELSAELDATREALRAHLFCDECEDLATRCHADTARFGCETHGIGEGWADTTHAAAVRAVVTR